MKKDVRLPHNKKEGFLYGVVICAITATIMTTLNVSLQFGKINGEVFMTILKAIPIMLIVAMLIETLIVGKVSERLIEKFTQPTDGFNAKILFSILFCVVGMSASMTILGGLLGSGLSWEPFLSFPSHWPRNFFFALWIEILLAQPAARFVMKKIHETNSNVKMSVLRSE